MQEPLSTPHLVARNKHEALGAYHMFRYFEIKQELEIINNLSLVEFDRLIAHLKTVRSGVVAIRDSLFSLSRLSLMQARRFKLWLSQ